MAGNYYQQWMPHLQQNTAYQPVYPTENIQGAPFHQQNTTFQPVYHAQPVHGAPHQFNAKPTEYFVEETEQYTKPQQTWFQAHFGGLKRTLRFFLAVTITVLIVNISWLIWAKTHYGGIESGYGIIHRGDCDAAKKTNTWLHLLINILSTLLLTGSNAFMSTYCCPSRKEIDKAHARRKWVHVGMLSLRNLGKIAWRKSFVVLLLGLSSLPFHLLYNSLVFVSLSSNNYYWTIATPDFATSAPYNLTGPLGRCGDSPCWVISDLPDGSTDSTVVFLPYEMDKVDKLYDYYDQIQRNASSWEKLSNYDCIQAYSNAFLSGRRNVVLVSSQRNETDSVLKYDISELTGGAFDNNWWICSTTQDGGNKICQPDSFLSKADDWTVWDYPIDYCLSEQIKDVCEVEFSMTIMIVVIVFNVIKVLAMTWVLFRYDAESILTSVGDSVSSFLVIPDHTTRGMCLAGRHDINQIWRQPGTGIPYNPRRQHWARAVSKGKWTLFILLMLISFGLIAIFGGWGFAHTKSRGVSLSFSSLWQLGFGAAHQDAIVIYDDVYNAISVALLANIPQIFLAAVWLLYMGIMTSMFLASDWAAFGTKAQTLMVSSPRGEQRGTWLLGAPLVYGIPLLVLQIILHWLVSQSIFVISLSVYNPDGSLNQTNPKYLNCGYSPVAIIFTIITSLVLMLGAMGLAFKRFPQGAPPVVATCSAAISAVCHLPDGMQRQDLPYAPLRWGQCGQPQYGVGQCALLPDYSFKMGYAQTPTVGWTYA